MFDINSFIQQVSIWAIPVLFAITVHETAHGWAALKFGDRTAQLLGRITLNPIKHIDPIGTVAVPLIAVALGGFIFGWAKPVPITPRNLSNPKTDMLWVALAGPASNLLMAIGWMALIKYLLTFHSGASLFEPLIQMAQAGITINLILMLFNLLPIPPLDGSRMLSSLLPNKLSWQLDRIEPYGMFIILGLFAMGLLGKIIGPMMQASFALLSSFFGLR